MGSWKIQRDSSLSSAYIQEVVCTKKKKKKGRAGRRNLMCCLLESHEVPNRTQIGVTVLESDGKVSVDYGKYMKQDRINALLHAY